MENSEDVNRVILQYRTLEILCNYFNSSYCEFLVPGIKYLLGLIGMGVVMIGVRVKVADSPFVSMFLQCLMLGGFCILVTEMVAASMMTNLWKMSHSFISDFKLMRMGSEYKHSGKPSHQSIAKYTRACARSLKTLRFAVGSFYYMEREARLTLASFLMTGSANLLIVFK